LILSRSRRHSTVRFGLSRIIFSDNNLGARLFGNYSSNRYQFNAFTSRAREEPTRRCPDTRHQNVYIAICFAGHDPKVHTIQNLLFNDRAGISTM
jgi:hypothetical protein